MSKDDHTPLKTGTSGTRASFLRKAGVGGATILGGGALLGAAARPAWAGHGDSVADADILNFALTLEYLEATFYTQALGGRGTTGVPASPAKIGRVGVQSTRALVKVGGRVRTNAYANLIAIRNHEVTHVDFLRTALGKAAVGPATYNFTAALRNATTFIATARILENTGVMAYDGAIRYVDTGDFLQAGAQIATVEARHAAYLNLISGASAFPTAFDSGKKPSEIVAAATPFFATIPPEVDALFKRLP